MPTAKVLLSSRERKALYRAIDSTDMIWSPGRRDEMLDSLDDGGVWNPCFLMMPENEEEWVYIRSLIHYGMEETSYRIDLTNVLDRLTYIHNRNAEGAKRLRWPFVKKKGYYGPNWDEQRERAIQRDGSRCIGCGLHRDAHRRRYGTDLHVHHEVPLKDCPTYEEANRVGNLKTLCFHCHIKGEYAHG